MPIHTLIKHVPVLRRATPRRARLVALIALCVTATAVVAAKAPVRTPDALQAQLVKMAPASKVECHKDSYGNPACTADGYSVDVTGCDGGMFFGQVIDDDGANLDDGLAPKSAKPLVHLARNHFLCIAATAKLNGQPARFFVEALPPEKIPACKGNVLCKTPPVRWVGTQPKAACTWNGSNGDFTGGCVAGWVDEDKIEQYTEGL